MILLVSTGMIFATDIDGFESLSSQATYGLFGNVMDDASSVGSGFSEIEDNYLFGGIIANPEQQTDAGSNSTFVSGYYNTGEKPWSVFGYFDFSGADRGTSSTPVNDTEETVVYNVAGEKTTTTYDVPGYDTINTQLQFLKTFAVKDLDFDTGLRLSISMVDGRLAADNYTIDSKVTGSVYKDTFTQEYQDPNGSIMAGSGPDGDETPSSLTFGANLPFYMELNGLEHSGAVSFSRTSNDYSYTIDQKNTTANTSYSESLDAKTGTSTISAWYQLTKELGPGDLSPYVSIARTKGFYDYTYKDDNGTVTTKTTYEGEYEPGFTFVIGSEYSMEFQPAGDWLQFKMKPGAFYMRATDSYLSGSKTSSTSGGITSTTEEEKAIDKTITNTLEASLKSAVEMKPENWFFGFQMGSMITMGWEKQTNELKAADTVDNAGNVTANKDTTNTVNYIDWTSTVDMEYGFFVPLPDDYRLDFKLFTNELTDFEQIAVELIVPLK